MIRYLETVTMLVAGLTAFQPEKITASISAEISEVNCPPAQVTRCTRNMTSHNQYVHIYDEEQGVFYLCDTRTDGGGWIVFQRRAHGSANFTYDWHLFKHGFGPVCDDYWLGNKYIHQITSSGEYELRIDMTYKSKDYFAQYRKFSIDTEEEQYTLHVTGFTGNVKDDFGKHDGIKFSSKSRDNSGSGCVMKYSIGWWFDHCHHANLNGYFGDKRFGFGVIWETLTTDYYSLTSVEMKIRKR